MMNYPIILKRNENTKIYQTTKHIDDKDVKIDGPIHNRRVLYTVLIIGFLVILTFILFCLIHLVIKLKKKKVKISSRKSLEEIEESRHAENRSRNNLLFVKLDPEALSRTGKPSYEKLSSKFPIEAIKSKSLKGSTTAEHRAHNFVIGCSSVPDNFLTSLSSPKRNYEELLDFLLSQQNELLSKESNTKESEQPILERVNLSQTPPKRNQPNYLDLHKPVEINRLYSYDSLETKTNDKTMKIESQVKTPSVICIDKIRPSKDTNNLILPPTRRKIHHNYDPVYVPRRDSVGVLKRIDNETSYITSRRLMSGIALTYLDKQNIRDDHIRGQILPSGSVALLQLRDAHLLSSHQPSFTPSLLPKSSLPSISPDIPPRISSKFSTGSTTWSATLYKNADVDTVVNTSSKLISPSNISQARGNDVISNKKRIDANNSQRHLNSGNSYETIDEKTIEK